MDQRALPPGRIDRAPYSYRADPAVPPFPDDHPIIVFDGHCALCSGWARFVMRHDASARFRLLAAQSPLGTALYRHYGLDAVDYETNLLIAEGRLWSKSESTIRMLEGLGRPWSWARVLRVVPAAWRDAAYSLIARNRLAWFGRRAVCYAPTADQKHRFLP